MNCVQCSKEMNCNGATVCDGCVSAAMTLMESCLGGRPTAAQVYRMFDMGGAGVMTQFLPVTREQSMEENKVRVIEAEEIDYDREEEGAICIGCVLLGCLVMIVGFIIGWIAYGRIHDPERIACSNKPGCIWIEGHIWRQ